MMWFPKVHYSGNVYADVVDQLRESENECEIEEAENTFELYEASLENER